MKDLNEATQKAKELFENSKQTVPGNWAKWYYGITDFPEEERKRAIKIEAKNMLGKTRYFISGWMVRPQGLITCNTPFGDK